MPLDRTTTSYVSTALAKCGVPLPDQAQQALDTLEALHAEAQRDLVAEALAAVGDDPLTPKNASKRVRDLAAAMTSKSNAATAARHFEQPVLDQFRAVILANTEALIVAMRPHFDQAAAVVQAAGAYIEPGASAATVVRDGDAGIVETYQRLTEAQTHLNEVQAAYFSVLGLGGYVERTVNWFIEKADDSEVLRLAEYYRKRGWHHLTHAGYTLRLNTPSETAAMVAAAEARSAVLADAEKRARVDRNRFPLRDEAYANVLGGRKG